jgi:hypothetical protein
MVPRLESVARAMVEPQRQHGPWLSESAGE